MGFNKKFFALLSVLLITAAAYLSVHIYDKITTARLDGVRKTESNTQKVSNSVKETNQSSADHDTIIERNFSITAQEEEIKPEKINIEELKKTNLMLRLWGTITGDNISAYAIIGETINQKQKLYREGDRIQNATVEMILRGMVVLSVDDRYEILKIQTEKPDINAKDKYGVTALIDASFKGQKEIVEILILKGADLDARDNKGDTALMNAAVKGHKEILELLLKNGADVHVKDNTGNSALIDSAKYAREATCEVIALLIDYGADVNDKNNYGVTALMNAAQWGHTENLDCLIAEGADIDTKSHSGETALKLAELSNHKDIIELLKNHGAKE